MLSCGGRRAGGRGGKVFALRVRFAAGLSFSPIHLRVSRYAKPLPKRLILPLPFYSGRTSRTSCYDYRYVDQALSFLISRASPPKAPLLFGIRR
jgi:hypothetical protein